MKKIKVGLDFDGVVAYNPFRIIRAPVTFFKRHILKIKPKFIVPHTGIQKFIWGLMHQSSIFPALGIVRLRQLANNPRYEFHLITGRYSFLSSDLDKWLIRHHLKSIFKSINVNVHNQQPNEYKAETIRRLQLEYFIEDNLDIVDYLITHSKAKIYWITNIIDQFHRYRLKYPNLDQALQALP